MLKPLFNKCLIEVLSGSEKVYVGDAEQNVQKGILIDFQLMGDHLTTSTGYCMDDIEQYAEVLSGLVGKVVYWEQYADSGTLLEQDGKKYALVPFYRLIAGEEAEINNNQEEK